jgi:hypothetical protein
MSTPRDPRTPARGSTLLLAMVLLAVLSVVGVAAVSLSSQERTNAAAKGKRDALFACANAARMVLWAELARYGQNHLTSDAPIAELVLPDGTRFAAPAHYDTPSSAVVKSVALERLVPISLEGETGDLTNSFRSPGGDGSTRSYTAVARCTDPKGRALEVEFVIAFSL